MNFHGCHLSLLKLPPTTHLKTHVEGDDFTNQLRLYIKDVPYFYSKRLLPSIHY